MSSQPTWIDRLSVEKISNQILMLQNYLPSLLTVEEIINALLFEHGPDVIENVGSFSRVVMKNSKYFSL